MAKLEILSSWILAHEGGYTNNPNDRGGATNRGVTIATFRYYYGRGKTINDLKHLTDEEWNYIFLRGFWNPFKGDDIRNQSVANICIDWAWMSGTQTAIKQVQRILGVRADGIFGKQSLAALNNADQRSLFDRIKARRIGFVENIVRSNPTQKVFIKGWKNRINSIKFSA